MKLSPVRDLVAVAELGGLRRASRHPGGAQPAASRSIRDLELELGVTLFERGSTGMTTTPAGQAFARRGAAAQAELERARDEVRQLRGEGAGHVAIGLSTAAHVALLPRVLPLFPRRHPEVRLRISEGCSPPWSRRCAKARSTSMSARPPKGGWAASSWWKSCSTITGWSCADAATRSPSAVNSAAELSPLFEQQGLPAPTVAVETQSALSMITVAASTDLLTVLPRQWLGSAPVVALLAHIPLDTTLEAPAICVVTRARLPLTPVAQGLFDLFRRAGLNE